MKKLISLSLLLLSSVAFLKGTLLAASQPIVEVPFEMQHQHMFFQMKINNSRPLNFVFDTGAGMAVLNPATAKELGINATGNLSVRGVGGMVRAPRYASLALSVGKISLRANAVGFSVIHLEHKIGKKIDGIIGADLLMRYVTQIDYDQKMLRFFDFEGFKYTGKGKKMRLKMMGSLATCPLTVQLPNGEKHTEDFLIDTGAGVCLGFTTSFSNTHQLTSKFAKKYRFYTSGATTNKTYLEAAKLPKLTLGGFAFQNIPVSISNTRRGVLGTYQNGGILGNRILKRFNITFNYDRRRAYWEPNQAYQTAFRQNCAGVFFSFVDNFQHIEVYQVIKGAPAQQAGLQKGDRILEVQGKPVTSKDVPWIKKQLGVPNREITLKIKRKKRVKIVRMRLKAMI
ncbi:MAG TPA: hypothetical protein DCS93_26815 [Microscillaceae bacterium]|nr:hypothetical protein [Microscillaceae bacterium]